MSKGQTNNEQLRRIKYTYTILGIGLIIAVVSIGINTYVLLDLYNGENRAEDPLGVAVQSLSKQVDNQTYNMEQRLVHLEKMINELPINELDYQQIMIELAELKGLKDSINQVSKEVEQYGRTNDEILGLVAVLRSDIENFQKDLGNRIDALVDKVEYTLVQPSAEGGDVWVTVEKGDSIWSLASKYKNPPDKGMIDRIIEYNSIQDPTKLKVGQIVIIPKN